MKDSSFFRHSCSCVYTILTHILGYTCFLSKTNTSGKLGKVKSLEKFTDLLLLLLLLLTGLLDLLLPRLAPPLYIFTSTLKRIEIATLLIWGNICHSSHDSK